MYLTNIKNFGICHLFILEVCLGGWQLSDDIIRDVLTKYRTVAIVGLSRAPSKPSHFVPQYLKNHGFRIIPVNPTLNEILGEKCYKDLLALPFEVQKTVEIIDIFRPSADVMPIVEQAVQLRKMHDLPYVVWMQLGIVNEQAAELAQKAGLAVVMDKCMMQEYRRIFDDMQ